MKAKKVNFVKNKNNRTWNLNSIYKIIKPNFSMRIQMFMVFSLVSILPVVLMGIFIFNKINSDINQSQKSMMQAYAKMVRNNVNTIINDSKYILKSLSSQSDLVVLMEDVNNDGEISEFIRLNKVTLSLENAVSGSEKLYETIFISDLSGKIIADGSKHNEKYLSMNISNNDYYTEIKEGKTFVVGEPIVSEVTKNYVLPVATSIETRASKLGVMVIMFNLSMFTSELDNIKIGQEGFPYIVSRNGNAVYYNKKEKLLSKVDNELITEQLKRLQSGEHSIEGVDFYNFEGIESVGAYTSIDSTNWIVVTSMPRKEFLKGIQSVGTYIFIVVISITALALIVSLMYSKYVTKPVNSLGILMKEVACGNIEVKADFNSNKEIKELSNNFNDMTNKLRDLINKIISLSKEVSNAANNFVHISKEALEGSALITDSIQYIVSGTIEQTSAVQKGVIEIEKITNNISIINEQSTVMKEASSKTDEIVKNGLKKVLLLDEKAEESEVVSNAVCVQVSELMACINDINDMLDVIKSISKQTNLLSLNAAIEAARAGEAGRGFTVVAEEVKKLSEISAAKTEEISSIIKSLECNAKNVYSITNKNKSIIDEQNLLVKETEHALKNIYVEINKVKSMINNTTEEIENINGEKDEIKKLMESIYNITNNTEAKSALACTTAEKGLENMIKIKENCDLLNKLSSDLNSSLRVFSTGV
ncbi:methyl-accepting chemotaxis protein [Clostridium thermarum]|uniref:methyl-accepting chemotaxis protein n=1 Tax=Clostridium thermarum TaxID=1716543 RepID=UPI00111CECAC|nr:methyl-accepting chemotaxis protein [Clostridium thermarum]